VGNHGDTPGKNPMSFSTTIGKGAEHNKALLGGLHDKAAVGDGASGSLIPPILLPLSLNLKGRPSSGLSTRRTRLPRRRWPSPKMLRKAI
jgi:hypothetical protein